MGESILIVLNFHDLLRLFWWTFSAVDSNIYISRSSSTFSSASPVYRATALGPSVSTSSSSQSISRSSSYEPSAAPQLRLLRPLGHGAFSAVWLAEDLSRVPLALVSKKSVRDLRRKASVRERDSENIDPDRDHEWKILQEKTRTPDGSQPRFEFGELDATPRPPAAVPSATLLAQTQTPTDHPKESPKRQASRLREGLRNMLAFSRGASATPTAVHTQASSSTATPLSSLGVDTDKSVAMYVDSEPPPASPMSSSSSMHSADFSPVSRASSLRSSTGGPEPLSRASSSGARLAPALRGEGDSDKATALLRDASLRKFRARVRGTRPALGLAPGRACLDERDGEMGLEHAHGAGPGDYLCEGEGERGVLLSSLARKPSSSAGGGARSGRLVAVKMTARRAPKGPTPLVRGGATGKKDARHRERERVRAKARREEEERTRVRFVREVEVLKVSAVFSCFPASVCPVFIWGAEGFSVIRYLIVPRITKTQRWVQSVGVRRWSFLPPCGLLLLFSFARCAPLKVSGWRWAGPWRPALDISSGAQPLAFSPSRLRLLSGLLASLLSRFLSGSVHLTSRR
ncbi:hypothetical protein HYPSUDRAFT_762105 [Hypholoma sublateritium FD-334 SS-4]|uniref:Uncharacterized protein n=1 Tax=Hypholoma sublateritium (strain FD-334 SS-4) TaxID=945553 RepID=A0A0D2L2Z3_HYPSF|nr:hypothetical protein HYPSUDRAFT_762105 [Hypholoma sublateritium FD-334 SS-4]